MIDEAHAGAARTARWIMHRPQLTIGSVPGAADKLFLHQHDLADRPFGDELARFDDGGQEAIAGTVEELHAGTFAGGDHGFAIGERYRQRLLAEDMQARLSDRLDDLTMGGSRRQDENQIDAAIGEETAIIRISARAEFARGGFGECLRDIADRDDLHHVERAKGGEMGRRHAAQADEADAKFSHAPVPPQRLRRPRMARASSGVATS